MGYNTEIATQAIVTRTQRRFDRYRKRTIESTDRLFTWLFPAQWIFAIAIALVFSPYAWSGKTREAHPHVWTALLLGAAIILVPVWLTIRHRGERATRHAVAFAQMCLSALLIHLSGGRIETHFHVFGSLAILAFYLDWTVLLTAGVTIAADHFIRGIVWPESVYGIANPEWWRFLEHGFWVAFCCVFLTLACLRHVREWLIAAEEGGLIEAAAEAELRTQRAEQLTVPPGPER
jgi:hypothetical protein